MAIAEKELKQSSVRQVSTSNLVQTQINYIKIDDLELN
jgi:hypothetical protein